MSKNQDLGDIKRGTTYPITFENTDSSGNPISLVGATVYFTAKTEENDNSLDDTTAAIAKDVTVHVDEDGVASAADGISTILLTATDTNIAVATYHYDITIKYAAVGSADPVVNTPIEGKFKIDGKPTNRSV